MAVARPSVSARTGFFAGFWLAGGLLVASFAGAAVTSIAECASHSGWLCPLYGPLSRLGALSAPVLVVALLIAVFYRGEIDSRIAFQRSAVYSCLAVVLVMLFGAIEHVLSEHLGLLLPKGGPQTISAGTCAIVLHPLKERIYHLVRTWF